MTTAITLEARRAQLAREFRACNPDRTWQDCRDEADFWMAYLLSEFNHMEIRYER